MADRSSSCSEGGTPGKAAKYYGKGNPNEAETDLGQRNGSSGSGGTHAFAISVASLGRNGTANTHVERADGITQQGLARFKKVES